MPQLRSEPHKDLVRPAAESHLGNKFIHAWKDNELNRGPDEFRILRVILCAYSPRICILFWGLPSMEGNVLHWSLHSDTNSILYET